MHACQQLVQPAEARLRFERLGGRLVAQHAEQPAHLRDHHAEVVGDDVVHLACDAGSLGGGSEATLLVALDFQSCCLLLQ